MFFVKSFLNTTIEYILYMRIVANKFMLSLCLNGLYRGFYGGLYRQLTAFIEVDSQGQP